MKTILAVAGAFLFGALNTNPAFAEENLAERAPEFQSMLQDVVDAGAPGLILLVQEGDDRQTFTAGFADRNAREPMQADYLLRMGSVSKLYTAAIIHQLIAEERLTLDTRMSEILDAQTLERIANADQVTIRQLLNHTSGIPDYYDWRSVLFWNWEQDPLTPERVIRHVRGKRATQAPGESYAYSNTNFHFLALIAETITGDALDTLYQRYVLEPVGTDNTIYSGLHTPLDRIHGYGGEFRANVDTYTWLENTGPDGGMVAPADEVADVLLALFAPDGTLADTGRAMLSEQVNASRSEDYGLGAATLVRRSTGQRFYGHTGGVWGYGTIAVYDAETDRTIVLHVNSNDSDYLMQAWRGTMALFPSD